MKTCTIYTGGRTFAPVTIADSFFTRFKGLMFRESLAPFEALLLKQCSSVHCMFMRFPIDVVYLDQNYRVLKIETVMPWRIGGIHRRVKHILEMAEGAGRMLIPGMKLEIRED